MKQDVSPPEPADHPLQTSWGSRADGDADDDSRLTPAPQPSGFLDIPPGEGIPRYSDGRKARQACSGIGSEGAWEKRGRAAYESSSCRVPSCKQVLGLPKLPAGQTSQLVRSW